ncbi:MAG: Uma2 family endonuclease [Coleofasciculus sp. C1-SOL-03]|jgi:Uma2 family endonuclease/DNA-binding CsgD family transcriptional regulator|uniref:Uma2 family endonuclease n=1 Tax=Coleofasciculus sp. C1-SOL-03 TaxID=3069522 RepID=UPI0032FFAF5C
MVQFEPLSRLPTSQELPCSDDTPVDNELQNLVPNLLLSILAFIWQERQDWFLGVDMGIYYLYENKRQPALVPDGFLSIGVPRHSGESGRLSYVLWEENNIPPILAMEVVSKKYNDEYEDKKDKYAQLGVLYYLIYNPNHWQRDEHQPLELYRLEQGQYILQTGEPYWMPEVGLGIGRGIGTYVAWTREWLFWYDEQGNAYPLPEELIEQERQRAEQERQRAASAETALQQQQQQTVTRLFALGLSLEQIATACNLSVEEVRAILE